MSIKTIERLTQTSESLSWLEDLLEGQAVDADHAQMRMALSLARSYCVEFAMHLTQGMGENAALAATIKGDLDLTASAETV